MNLLGAVLYDPTTAVTKGSAASAMAAFDTTNARIQFTVPPSGRVRVVVACTLHGATTYTQALLGVMEGATVKGKIVPLSVQNGTPLATTAVSLRADFVVPGLTPGAALTWDAAWGIETFVTASLLKYGGPGNATGNNDFGALQFEIWDPSPLYAPAVNGVPPTTSVHSKLDTNATYIDTEMAAVLAAVDTEVAAIKAKTDSLTFTTAGKVDATIQAAADLAQAAADKVWSTATRALTDKSGFALTQSFPANFSALAITAGGAVTAGTVSDKTGYALTQTFPTNFASLAITAGGAVTAGTVSDKSGYSLTTAPLDAAGTRTALGLASANLDTQIATLATAANLATATGYIDTEVASILAAVDTEIGALQTTATAIKNKTDSLTFTVANKVDANACCINGATVAGAGTSGDKWRGA